MAMTVAEAIAARHPVTVLCGRPSYEPSERRDWQLYRTEEYGRIRVIRAGSTDYSRVQMKRRMLNYLSYVLMAVPRALFLPCDVVLAMTDPPFEGIVGAFVAMMKNKPYVYNIRDMYPDMAVGGSIVKPGLLARVWEKMHRWALRRATTVVVLGEDMRNRILAKGVNPERVVVIRDGTEIPALTTAKNLDQDVIEKIRGGFRFVVVHAGNLGFYGSWETLLEGMRLLGGDEIGLVFVGDGAQRERLQHLSCGLGNVKFLPFFPANKVPSVLAAADAHLITVKRGLEGVVVPSKMYGILAAGRPIIAVAPTECDVASIGERVGFSLTVDPDDPPGFAACLRNLAGDSGKLARMGEAASRQAPEYEQKRELGKLVALIERAGRR